MKTILIFTIFASINAYSHGEDKYGPYNGYIRMPGAYHTEVVPEGPDKFKVYLLDMKWKNPTLKQSLVKAMLIEEKNKVAVHCEAKDNHYLCVLPKGRNLNQGVLELESQRENQKGNVAIYKLPLKLEKSAEPEKSKHDDHSGHH
jgi:hypothetical protein